ncbi:MAG: peptidoglycan editing factor PgeF [Deltaproteobacteria bacterium]
MGWIKSDILLRVSGIAHGFSDGNLGGASADAARSLGLERIVTVRQIHGDSVYWADGARYDESSMPEADAIVSGAKGVGAGIFTADCVPVLIAGERGVVAAVHAGWRGIYREVVEATLLQITERRHIGAGELAAAVGPCIGSCCYEVGEEVASQFTEKFEDAGAYIRATGAGKYRLDLREATRAALEKAGVRRVDVIDICTKCRADFHSYRRDGRDSGRQISVIGIL